MVSINHSISVSELERLRKAHIGPSVALFFSREPLCIIRGEGPYIYDERNQRYLDCINNVSHVGHSHPYVVQHTTEQMRKLNTNSRYLHPNMVLLAKRLLETLPAGCGLDTCYFVNSGSEANDLALRLARAYTGALDVLCVDHAYHGHLTSIWSISPYKFRKETPGTLPQHTFVADSPDEFRGKYRLSNGHTMTELGNLYANDVQMQLKEIEANGGKLCAFIHEGAQSCAGQLFYPDGYLRQVYALVRQHGGLAIADEVQSGFGRIGKTFWAFQMAGEDVVPDIVTLGKSMGNGLPVSCVITRRSVAERFLEAGYTYFNTYGGNPVVCASSLAVLDVLQREGLQQHAARVGNHILAALRRLMQRHQLIGDVRGSGLFIGIEMVKDRVSKQPAAAEAREIIYRCKRQRVILSTDGPDENVVKIKPPMCFSQQDADWMLCVLDQVLHAMERDRFSPSCVPAPGASADCCVAPADDSHALRQTSALCQRYSSDFAASHVDWNSNHSFALRNGHASCHDNALPNSRSNPFNHVRLVADVAAGAILLWVLYRKWASSGH